MGVFLEFFVKVQYQPKLGVGSSKETTQRWRQYADMYMKRPVEF